MPLAACWRWPVGCCCWCAACARPGAGLQDHQDLLRVQSERDALPGVTSRRHAQALLRAAGQAAGGFSGALLMIDIDHFKQVNDGQGHTAGDQVLAETARRIAATVRPQDLVARWGGEEFLVHAPGLTPDAGEALALRLLRAVSGTPVDVAGAAALRRCGSPCRWAMACSRWRRTSCR